MASILQGDLMGPTLIQRMPPMEVTPTSFLQQTMRPPADTVAPRIALGLHLSSLPSVGAVKTFPRGNPAAQGVERTQLHYNSGCSSIDMPRGESWRLSSGFSVDAKPSGSHGESSLAYADSAPLSALVSLSSPVASMRSHGAGSVGFDGRLEQPLTLAGCVTSSASPTTSSAIAETMESAWPHAVDGKLCELASIGSALHALHRCRPCSFVGRQEGCAKRFACKFCHFPHEERININKRPNRTKRRAYDKLIGKLEDTLEPSADAPRLVDLAQVLASIGHPLPKLTQASSSVAVALGTPSSESSSSDRDVGMQVIMKFSF